MSESKFKHLQKDVCEVEEEVLPLKKFCAPCVPNESYIEPDWAFIEVGEPYLNEKQCEYQITVTVNKYGDTFSAKQFRDLQGRQKSFESRELLLRSFVHPALTLILEENGKLVADQIICASYPSISNLGSPIQILQDNDGFEAVFLKLSDQPVDRNSRCKDIGTAVKVDPTKPFDFSNQTIALASREEVKNPFALELYTQVHDFFIDPIEDVLKVHIGVPSFVVDNVPELPSAEELREEAVTTSSEVTLKVSELYGQVLRLEASLRVFGKYQSSFYQTQDGFLLFKESQKDFYASRMAPKVRQFYKDLKSLAKKNDVNIRSELPSLTKLNADNVRIEFKEGPSGNPYVIKAIYVSKEGCEEKKLRKGIKAFKKTYDKKPTVLNYIAKIKRADTELQARESTPWMDFLIKYTYPLLTVRYGNLSVPSAAEALGECAAENIREFGGDLRDYILGEVLSFADALSFQYSSAASCEELFSDENQPENKEFEDVSFGLSEGRETRKQAKEDIRTVDDEATIGVVDTKKIDLFNKKSQLTGEMKVLDFEIQQIEESLTNLAQISSPTVSEQTRIAQLRVQKVTKETKSSNLAIKINELESEIKELDSAINYLRGQTGSISNKLERQARKAAARKARKNAKSHPYVKKARKAALDEIKTQDTLLANLIDWEEYEESGKLTRKKFEKTEKGDSTFKNIMARLSICNAKALTISAVRCLFSGVTKERAFDKMFRAAMQAMDLDVFGFFIENLPPDKQAELRDKFQQEFGNIPLPWEEGYDSGAEQKNAYKNYLSRNPKAEQREADRVNNIARLEQEISDLDERYGDDLVEFERAMSFFEEAQEKYNKNKEAVDLLLVDNNGEGIIDEIQRMMRFNLEESSILLTEAERRLKEAQGVDELKATINSKIEELEALKADEPKEIKDFKELTDKEKRERIKQQQKGQGTFGKPLGNIQEAVVEAYIEYIFDVLNYDEIGQYLSQFPGGTLVFNTFNQIFKCSTQGLFDPPIKSFLSTLSLDVCGEERNVGIAIPEQVKEVPWREIKLRSFFLSTLRNAFVEKVETITARVITMFLLKLFETVDNALCKSLNAVGKFAAAQLTGAPNAGLDQAFADAFCPDADEDELNNIKKNAFGNALGKGAAPDEAYDCLFKTINGTMSKREIIELLTNTPSQMDEQTAQKFALLVNSKCPELSDLLGDADSVKDAFGSIGKYIPPELRDFLRNRPEDELESPIYDAVCLTQEELDKWNRDRKDLYLDNGLDEETADELINKANDRALDNLGSLSDMLQKGPEGILGEALAAALNHGDPACATDPSAIIRENEDVSLQTSEMINDYFDKIEKKFMQDLLQGPASLLNNILIDTLGKRLNGHRIRVNFGDRSFIFRDYVNTEEQWEEDRKDKFAFGDREPRGMFPETVGKKLLEELKAAELKYKTIKDKPQVTLKFEASFDDDTVKNVLKYKLRHGKKSGQRIFNRETRTGKVLGFNTKDGPNLTLESMRLNHYDPKELGIVNYDFIPNEVKLLSNMLKNSSNSTAAPTTSKLITLFDNWNSMILKKVRDSIIEKPNGKLPIGFDFGYSSDQEIKFEDLLYVNPEANPNDESTWEYSYDEADGVLGKSATENPRVYFLDPTIHGGRYRSPKIYIEPATYSGWLGTIQAFIPEATICEDVDNGFLGKREISARAKEVEGNLPFDSRLNQPLDCRLEYPYDRQLMPVNHGMLEGIVLSTVRTYATEFIIKTFPIFGSIQYSTFNVDSLVANSITYLMEEEMSDAGFSSAISRLGYFLLFLEQCVQVTQRQVIDGLIEETEEMREASKIIGEAQSNYEQIQRADLVAGVSAETARQIRKGSRILAYGANWESRGRGNFTFATLSMYKINMARKVAVIHDTMEAAKVYVSALISKEIETLSKRINLNLRPRPHIYDIRKYLLSQHGLVYGSSTKSGLTSVEQQVIEGGNQPDYGSIVDCSKEDLLAAFSTTSLTLSSFRDSGLMYVDKYIRVMEKSGVESVMTVREFKRKIASRQYDKNSYISENFGNAKVENGEINGTIGVKFGVRINFCAPKSLGLDPQNDKVAERLPSFLKIEEVDTPVDCMTLVSFESDLPDTLIKDIDTSDENLGQELKCYVDKLVEQENFSLLFESVFKTKSFVSLFASYSFVNFVESIGRGEGELDEKADKPPEGWKGLIFNDTKRVLRKQFKSIYNSQDDKKPSRPRLNRDSNINFLKNLLPPVYLNIGSVGFLKRLKIVGANPFDENGEACGNEFQKLFKD